MNEQLIAKKLEDVDKELHLLLNELKFKERRKSLTLSELNKIVESERISDKDTTELIREMREKKYDV